MRRIFTVFLFLVLTAGGPPGTLFGQEPTQEPVRTFATSVDIHGVTAVQQAATLVDTLALNGDLRLVSSRTDRYRVDRQHDTFRQFHLGVPVRGGGITRQRDTVGPVSFFGTIYADIDIGVAPQVPAADAVAILESLTEAALAANSQPELIIVPTWTDGYALAWRITMDDYHEYALNAHTGGVEYRDPLFHSESTVGAGAGIAGVRKKVSARVAGGRFEAFDELRPAEIATLDVRFSDQRLNQLVRGSSWSRDIASDDDNEWSDHAVVDAHVHTGFTYDYLLAQHGWRGVDGRDGRILSIVNMDAQNASAYSPPFGPERRGVFAYGRWGDSRIPWTSADIVAHEIMHIVTYFSVVERTGERLHGVWSRLGPSAFTRGGRTYRCGESLYYTGGKYAGRRFRFYCENGRFALFANLGSAINEAYSDIIGTSVEFAVHEPGMGPLRADYLNGEDTGRTLRSLEDPRSLTLGNGPHRYPDAYQGLVRFLVGVFEDSGTFFYDSFGSVDGGRTMTRLPSFNYGGQHWNSTILSHAFYLAIEGGRNRTTGRQVQGVGAENRAQVERVFFRAMTDLMPALTNFHRTAAAIRQSAIDLDGAGSALYQAIDDALSAVGLPEATQ